MKNQAVFEQGSQGDITLRSWAVPVVEVHEIEQLTMSGADGAPDEGTLSS